MPVPEFSSILYRGEDCIGQVRVRPCTDDEYLPFAYSSTMRINCFSPPSQRCQPLSVIHSISTTGVWFTLDADDQQGANAGFNLLYSTCIADSKTAMVGIDGGNELHLVALPRAGQQQGFWGFVAPEGTYASCLAMLNLRCLALVFDLDETLIIANTMRSFYDRIEALHTKLRLETDPDRAAGLRSEIKRYGDDRAVLQQYLESDSVLDGTKLLTVQTETVPSSSDSTPAFERPIIRLPDRNIILTRINPGVRDTSVLVKLRPGWEELKSYLIAKGRKRFEVFICTMSEKDYALEMWRLLDSDARLIPSMQLQERVVCVKGQKKSLTNVFRLGSCHPRMAIAVDDRLEVWDDVDQPRVHVVPPFAPYYAPQAEASANMPVLGIARNAVCNVRSAFFKDFDDRVSQFLARADFDMDIASLPRPLDVSDYLKSQGNIGGAACKDFSDGMADSETESVWNSQPPGPSTSTGADELSSRTQSSLAAPLLSQLANKETQAVEPSGDSEEGEVPVSELDPITRSRLLIMQHGLAPAEQEATSVGHPGSSNVDKLYEATDLQRSLLDYSDEDDRLRMNGIGAQPDAVMRLQQMSQACKAQLEFRSSISSTVELQFCAEVIFNGEKIATGVGRTSREARLRACQDALRSLTNCPNTGLQEEQKLFNGGIQSHWNLRQQQQQQQAAKAFNAEAALRDLCTFEKLRVVFHDLQIDKQSVPTVYNCEVEVSGEIVGRGRGLSWDAAKQEASEEALRGMKSKQQKSASKRNHSPRSAAVGKRGRGGRGGHGRGGAVKARS